ncbi:uncharacterized protein [Salminus brasiliensis]|uniref:uncharacterized protein isoform X2 n=1 Tax=Salminus brasiliensis TaxID=930266 RepID=UPI003B82E149
MESSVVSAKQPDYNREDVSPGTNSEKENRSEASQQATGTTKQLCRFYSQGHRCHYGKRCNFLHQKFAPSKALRGFENRPGCVEKEESAHSDSPVPQQQSNLFGASEKEEYLVTSNLRTTPTKQVRAQRPCRYFMSGFCTMEDHCRFWHPQQFASVEDRPVGPRKRSSDWPRPLSCRPPALQEQVRLADLTEEMIKKLRDTEISQLKKSFSKDRLIVQEKEDSQLTYYRVTVEATDPEWAYDLKELDIMVSFPENYPQEVFTVDVPEDQHLPSLMGRHIQLASQEWLQAKHATRQLLGKVELLFRPYLRWLDRSMERLFTEGATQLKKYIDLERAGIQFVPYEQLQATVSNVGPSSECLEGSLSGESLEMDCKAKKEHKAGGVAGREQVNLGNNEESKSQRVENIKSSEPRKGTEIKLLGLRLGEGMATVEARRITVSMQCSRCKVTSDLTLSSGLTCTAHCEKCGAEIRAAFRPRMLHHYSDVLGYLDLYAAAAVDLVLQDCQLIVGCLNCNKEDTIQHLPYGQNKETYCQHCHSKLSIFVEATRFQYIQPKIRKKTGQESALQTCQCKRNPAVQHGKPLPEKGACKHYRQSHRWLRFPCCGWAYPCDVCHNEGQDHLMELATRMICGYCAKEQPYSNGKPCVGCGGMMTRGTHTSHWEGGQGCRSKVKMSRNDRHKYTNMCKTMSRKANSEM